MLGAHGYHERVALPQDDRGFPAIRVAKGDVELAVEDEEELIGVRVCVPDVLAFRMRGL